MKGVYSMNKHNWNQLSASSKRYLEQAQNDRMINESYQDGYRQGLSERGPGPGTPLADVFVHTKLSPASWPVSVIFIGTE